MDIQMFIGQESFKVDYANAEKQSKRSGPQNLPHRHPVFHFIFITHGRGLFHIEDRSFMASANQLIIVSPNELHDFSCDADQTMSNYEVTISLQSRGGNLCTLNFFTLIEQSYGVTLPETIKNGPLTIPIQLQPLLIDCFQRAIKYQQLHASTKLIHHMVLELTLQLAELIIQISNGKEVPASDSIDLIVAKVSQYIETQLHRPLQLKDMARFVYLSPNYLCRIFRQRTGLTPLQYTRKLRIAEAIKLLHYTETPISRIAEELGFNSVSYFDQVFRAEMKVTPSDFRNNRRLIVSKTPD